MSLYVFILSIVLVSFVQSDKLPCVICAYGGTLGKSSYQFSLSDVPNRCEAVLYGGNFFNVETSDSDKTAITALTSANKIVYMMYSYADNVNWTAIMTSKDPCVLDQQIAPMINYLKTTKIKGLILAYLDLFVLEITDYATKIKALICKIREALPTIKIGLLVSGLLASKYKDTDLFDLSVTNSVVDLYIIDTANAGDYCTKDTTANGGRYPIKSKKKIVTLEQICLSSSNSPMEQGKILIHVVDLVNYVENNDVEMKSYSEYCRRSGKGIWCGDTTQLLYGEVKYVKKYFKGIMISFLDFDDYDNTCGCGKFPVANTFIDAWQDKPIKCCDKI